MSNSQSKFLALPYAVHQWIVESKEYSEAGHKRDETIFAVANGFLGVRANFERRLPRTGLQGTYLNGFYDTAPIVYPEGAHALAKNRQTMLNVSDAQLIDIVCNGEEVSLLSTGSIVDYSQRLDMRTGVVTRTYVWSSKGAMLRITTERIASFVLENLFAQRLTIDVLSDDCALEFNSVVDGKVKNQVAGDDPRVGSGFTGRVLTTEHLNAFDDICVIVQRTSRTKFALCCAALTKISQSDGQTRAEIKSVAKNDEARTCYKINAKKGQTIVLEKFACYFSSLTTPEGDLITSAVDRCKDSAADGFEKIAEAQAKYLSEFWQSADVTVDGDPQLQQGIRFNLFHLLQSVGKNGRSNISAKGLTGEGYEGHYFWDTEIYVLPVFLFTKPIIARRLIEHRASMLPFARDRAQEMSQRGALFAWRTIGGEETSAYYPAGTAQYHINADVFLALKRYVDATGDREILLSVGAEVLFETARLWADLGCYIEGRGFCINGVTGPDEYSAVVNNNAYTNVMAKDHLEYAVEIFEWLSKEHPASLKSLMEKLTLSAQEVRAWEGAAQEMLIPRDPTRGIIKQDDSCLDRKPWDFVGTPKEKYPLLLNFHPLVIYRHQVLKQADVVLALLLQSDRFTREEKKRNFDYYEPLTTHDSSLSTSIHSIIASELGYLSKAYEYFIHTARTDLDDLHRNTGDGIHAAAMAGTWAGIIHGFAGMREHHGRPVSFNPRLPGVWKGYSFRVGVDGSVLLVEVANDTVKYTNIHGSSPLVIMHRSRRLTLAPGKTETCSIRNEFRGAIFDLDGVLTDTAECHYLAWKQIADELKLPFDRAFNEKLKGVSRSESLDLILSQSSKVWSAAEKAEMCDRKNGHFREMVSKLTEKDVFPGVKEFLGELKQAGIPRAIASASRNAKEILERLGLISEFDFVVDASTVLKGKPDPEVFVKAATGIGLLPEECVGFEDAATGIRALRNCCMAAIGVASETESLPGAHAVLPSMREMKLDKIRSIAESVFPVID